MTERKIIEGLMELCRDMGCVIRQLDDESEHPYFWQQDGCYIADGRYRAAEIVLREADTKGAA